MGGHDARRVPSQHVVAMVDAAIDLRCRVRRFPVVVITSNGEREFPAPFLRRCLRPRQRRGRTGTELQEAVFRALPGSYAPDASRLRPAQGRNPLAVCTGGQLPTTLTITGPERQTPLPARRAGCGHVKGATMPPPMK
jgi:hypothetical protein